MVPVFLKEFFTQKIFLSLKNLISITWQSGLLILRDGAISHNRPKIATNRIIHEKSHNLFKIAQFKKRKTKISLCIKFSDILIVI